MVSDLLGSRRFPSKVQVTSKYISRSRLVLYGLESKSMNHESLTLGNGSPLAVQESSTSDPTRIVEFLGAVVIMGGSETKIPH